MTNNTILFNAVVIDNEDPLMLGRVRARFLNPPSDMGSYEDITRSINNPIWSEEDDKWTSRDPFIFLPLIPYFLYQVPKVDEFIQLIYLMSITEVFLPLRNDKAAYKKKINEIVDSTLSRLVQRKES